MPAEVKATEPEAAPPRGLTELEPRFEERLHAGELVDVWRAALPSGEPVAVKVLKPRWLHSAGAVAMLRREHRLLEALRHPRIVTPLGYIERPDCCAVALEYLGCGDLLPLAGAAPRHWIGAALDVVDALEHVHDQGYVHCDLKARNVLFATAERAKLADLGSALAVGTPLPRGGRTGAHVPREPKLAGEIAVESVRAVPALDVYSLAVLLYELLSGRLPFGADPQGRPDTLRSPLREGAGASPAVAALAERVTASLSAADVAGVGTLTAFRNVLESVRSHFDRPGEAGPTSDEE
jgi:serine/threonine protein kinase